MSSIVQVQVGVKSENSDTSDAASSDRRVVASEG